MSPSQDPRRSFVPRPPSEAEGDRGADVTSTLSRFRNQDMFRFDTVDSTNDAARRLIADGRMGNLGVVIAETQTAGRGTNRRHWQSPPGGIYLSVVHRDVGWATHDTRLFTQSAGIACVEAIQQVTGLHVRLKPINDLTVDGRKLGGILTESSVEDGRVTALITGVGLNANPLPTLLPGDCMPATSLRECLHPDAFARFRRDVLIDELATHIDARHRRLLHGGQTEVESIWRSLLA